MKKLFLLALSALLTAAGFAQSSKPTTGHVLDAQSGHPLPGIIVTVKSPLQKMVTDMAGKFMFKMPADSFTIEVQCIGYETLARRFSPKDAAFEIKMTPVKAALNEVVVTGYAPRLKKSLTAASVAYEGRAAMPAPMPRADYNTDEFNTINENAFHPARQRPLSTFSADVDRASYSVVRKMLNSGYLPPADAVRVEELINYFDYVYPAPVNNDPVAIHTDLAICPWNTQHQLVRIGIQGKKVPTDKLPASNLVFLIDVSGSMNQENRLPLVKQAFKALVQQLRPQDRVAIVVYAGAAGLVLPSTSGREKMKITEALEQLSAGGSTAGGAGIQLAYQTALEHFIKEGNNRVILATDGDFNVGVHSDGDLAKLVEAQREKGVFLSVLGFGMGNYKDNHLETLADKGNGNYAYIDNFEEARRTFVTEFGGTLFTIAKDVKLQVEFNPKIVQSYRLIGYENRLLNDADFNDDRKDAGDMGAGHTVTALYEIVPAGVTSPVTGTTDPLKYQPNTPTPEPGTFDGEVLTVKMRYKEPNGKKSRLVEKVLRSGARKIEECPEDFRLAASVAEFGMLLRNSAFSGRSSWEDAIRLAASARGEDPEGYRAEYLQLLKKAKVIREGIAKK